MQNKPKRQEQEGNWWMTTLGSNKNIQTTEIQVKEKDAESQPTELPPRKILAKKTRVQQPPRFVHYPFNSAKEKKLFRETIQGKQAMKERALDLDSSGSTDSDAKRIINFLRWKKFCRKWEEGVL